MDPALLESLFSRSVLLPTGICLVIVGVIMRGLARGAQRDRAFRKQGDLLDDASADPLRPPPDAIDRHLEKHLPRYATATVWLGVLLAVVAFFR